MSFRLFVSALFFLTLGVSKSSSADALDIAYGDDAKQRLDVYEAQLSQKGKACPVVIWVHGGGWRHGDKDNQAGTKLCKTWAKEGIVMVNLNYRLSPAVMHPAHVQDVAAGIAWVHKNIAAKGGDPTKIFLLGHSAGAHLVALVACDPQYLKTHGLPLDATLAGVMSIDTASYDLNSTRSPIVRKMIKDAFGTESETLASASPLTQAKRNRETIPPFIIATVKQRPEALRESAAFNQTLPHSKFIELDYPEFGQLKAHAKIATDLMNLDCDMTKQLLAFVKGTTPRK